LRSSSARTNFSPVALSFTFHRENHRLAQQVGKDTDVSLALAHLHLVNPHATDIAQIQFGIGRLDMGQEQAPQTRIMLAQKTAKNPDPSYMYYSIKCLQPKQLLSHRVPVKLGQDIFIIEQFST